MDALVSAAAIRTKRFLGLTYPRDGWWTKLGVAMLNVLRGRYVRAVLGFVGERRLV